MRLSDESAAAEEKKERKNLMILEDKYTRRICIVTVKTREVKHSNKERQTI